MATKTTSTVSFTPEIGDTVSIVLAAALNNAPAALSLAVAAAHGEIIAVTAKAIQLSAVTDRNRTIRAWLPRRAILPLRSTPITGSNHSHHTAKLAHWFQPTGWTDRFLALATEATAAAA